MSWVDVWSGHWDSSESLEHLRINRNGEMTFPKKKTNTYKIQLRVSETWPRAESWIDLLQRPCQVNGAGGPRWEKVRMSIIKAGQFGESQVGKAKGRNQGTEITVKFR